jgi:hypothetical protein
MAAEENLIGKGTCPVCGSEKARFTISKKQLACMTCNACNCQIFARSDFSDEKLRACVRPAAPAAQIIAAKATPAAPVKTTPAPARVGFGLLGAW